MHGMHSDTYMHRVEKNTRRRFSHKFLQPAAFKSTSSSLRPTTQVRLISANCFSHCLFLSFSRLFSIAFLFSLFPSLPSVRALRILIIRQLRSRRVVAPRCQRFRARSPRVGLLLRLPRIDIYARRDSQRVCVCKRARIYVNNKRSQFCSVWFSAWWKLQSTKVGTAEG